MPLRSPGRLAWIFLTVLPLVSCGRAPTSPDTAPAAAQPAVSVHTEVIWTPFALSNGTFAASSSSKEDTISGQYSGQAFVSSIGQTAVITLRLTGGTGAFGGATGTITGAGTGAFADEGSFAILFQGTIATAAGPRSVRLAFRGESTIACTATSQVRVTQTAEGGATASGRVSATLRHDVSGASCTS